MKKGLVIKLCSIFLLLAFQACLIQEVEQPASIGAGEVFETIITVNDINAENNNDHRGVLCIMVPDDWSFLSGTYDWVGGAGDMVLDPAPDSPVYGYVDTLIPPPVGMQWIKLLTDIGYYHDANVTYEAIVEFQVGQTGGDFPIGYLVTVNTIDMFDFLAVTDVDDPLNGTDTLMNQWVTVTGGIVGVDENVVIKDYLLAQNYPNPFNPETIIKYQLNAAAHVELSVFDITGRTVSRLVNEYQMPDNYKVTFRGNNLPSGTYIYRLKAGNQVTMKKMVLLQ